MKEKSKKVINTLSIIYSSIIVFICSIVSYLNGTDNGIGAGLATFWIFGVCSGIMCIIQFIYLNKKNKKYLKSLNIANLICAGLAIVFTIIFCIFDFNLLLQLLEISKIRLFENLKKFVFYEIAPFIIIINVIFLFLACAYIKMDDTPKLKFS